MTKLPTVYAFIDSQNLNLGVRSLGWKIDYAKFRLYLKNKYGVTKALLFIGLVDNNQKLYSSLETAGFILIYKSTVRYLEDGKETYKGNVDAELVLHSAAIEYDSYDKAIIISGDGDFTCLVKFLLERKKLLHVLVPNRNYSKLFKPYMRFIIQAGSLENSIAKRSDQSRRSVETLGVAGPGDDKTIT